jgi:hypothetical protein
MRDAVRPIESASVDENLRIRLEGAVERLEDALPLLESLMELLSRVDLSRDDVATLQECLTRLPRIDEAIDKANRHQGATALTRLLRDRLELAFQAANDRLRQIDHAEAPSLRAAVSVVLDLVKKQGSAPRADERQLARSSSPAVVLPIALGVFVAALASLAVPSNWSVLLGCLVFFITVRLLAPSRWILLPDRIFFPPQRSSLARELAPASRA